MFLFQVILQMQRQTVTTPPDAFGGEATQVAY